MAKVALIIILFATFAFSKVKVIIVQDAWERYPSADVADNGEPKIDFPAVSKLDSYNKTNINEIKADKLRFLEENASNLFKENGRKAETYVEIGVLYAQNMFYKMALSYFTNALSIDSKNSDIYNNIANIYYMVGKNKLAIKYYKYALRYAKNNPIILLNLAFIHYETGRFKEARKSYLTAILIDPTLDQPEYQVIGGVSDGTTESKASNKGVRKMPLKWAK